MLKFQRLQILVDGVGHFSQNDGSRVLNLFLGEECITLTFVTAVRAVARSRTFDSSARRNLEISKTTLDRAFPAKVAVLVSSNWNAELGAETVEITCTEASHFRLSFLMKVSHPFTFEACSSEHSRGLDTRIAEFLRRRSTADRETLREQKGRQRRCGSCANCTS